LLPDLVTAAASLASIAPYEADGLDYFVGMSQDDAEDTRLLLTDPEAALAKTDKDREGLLAASASDLAQGFASMSAPVDAAVLQGEGEMAASLAYAIHDGLANPLQDQHADHEPLALEQVASRYHRRAARSQLWFGVLGAWGQPGWAAFRD
jgi:hypothetical protein